MDLANLKLDCLGDRPDARDFSLIEAINRLSREGNQEIKYVLFDITNYKLFLAQYDRPKEEVIVDASGEMLIEKEISIEEEYKILNSSNQEEKERLFRKFKVIDPSKNSDFYATPSSVLIPLRQSRLTIESREGEGLVLIGDDGNAKGRFGIEDGNKIKLFRIDQGGNQGEEINAELVINGSGQVSVAKEAIKTLYLGEGFRSYSIDKGDEASSFPEIEDQRTGGLCSACAGVGLLEYLEMKIYGRYLNASKLFLHQVACKLMRSDPYQGVSIRAVVTAMKIFGVPPEDYWPYNLDKLAVDPPSDCYAYAGNYRVESYFRLDRFGMTQEALIAQIKIFVYTNIPVICSFSVHESISESADIPYPRNNEIHLGNHAVIIIGYDDNKEIKNHSQLHKTNKIHFLEIDKLEKQWDKAEKNSEKYIWPKSHFTSKQSFISSNAYIRENQIYTKGAFKIRNSWGKEWGDKGYGWLPYAYIYQGLASDFWTVLRVDIGDILNISGENSIQVCKRRPCST